MRKYQKELNDLEKARKDFYAAAAHDANRDVGAQIKGGLTAGERQRKIVELNGFKDPSQFFNQIPADYQPPERARWSDLDGGYPGCGPCMDVDRMVELLPRGVHGPRREWCPVDVSPRELRRIEDELLEEVRLDEADSYGDREWDDHDRHEEGCL
jgi:hypothetical protein